MTACQLLSFFIDKEKFFEDIQKSLVFAILANIYYLLNNSLYTPSK